jgi:Uma2 family endonuclease
MTLAVNQPSTTRPSLPAETPPEPPHSPRVKRWTTEEYLDWVNRGAFEGQRLYLFRGELIEMSPMGSPHSTSTMKSTSAFTITFPVGPYFVRVQCPFITPGDTLPEPDFAICTKETAFHLPYPKAAVLIVEVADSSLAYDREKALEYAAAGVQEYWIIDLNDRCIEVYRNPVPDRTAPLGFRYPPPTVVRENETISPLAMPTATVKVIDLLP